MPAPPRVNLPSTAAPTDIEALAWAGARSGSPAAQTTAASPLRIFITLEMPCASLQLLTDQADAQRRGPRAAGPEGQLDARDPRSRLQPDRRASGGVGDRPEAFARHRIERAPTFVLSLDDRADTATSCGTDCRTPPAFVSVSGDVSLDHALDTLARQRPEARRCARARFSRGCASRERPNHSPHCRIAAVLSPSLSVAQTPGPMPNQGAAFPPQRQHRGLQLINGKYSPNPGVPGYTN